MLMMYVFIATSCDVNLFICKNIYSSGYEIILHEESEYTYDYEDDDEYVKFNE
jgi:hypothetical protein